MNEKLEILKEEDGLTIIKLSDKKILFKYKIPIVLSTCGSIISYINVKIRYRIEHVQSEYLPLSLEKIIRSVSNKMAVKMANIGRCSIVEEHLEKNFVVIKSFMIVDKVWERNYKLEKYIYDEIECNK